MRKRTRCRNQIHMLPYRDRSFMMHFILQKMKSTPGVNETQKRFIFLAEYD